MKTEEKENKYEIMKINAWKDTSQIKSNQVGWTAIQ